MSKTKKEYLAYIDELTGIYNRRYLKEVQKRAKILQNKHLPYSVIIVDIDHFKDINDSYGHPKGDEIIKNFAQFLKNSLRTTDTLLRYGGDEFVCIMPDATRRDAEQIYTRILNSCKAQKFSGIGITVSVGISSYPDDGEGLNDLLKIADESLYEAKRSGRDRIGGIKKRRLEIPALVFVGRREEKELLRELLTRRDGVRVMVVRGNVGIGKTRLVREVLGGISGQEVLWADCLVFFEAMPYYPVRELIRYKMRRFDEGILSDIPLAYRVELGKLVPEVMKGIKEKITEVGLVLDRFRLYESVRQLLETGKAEKVVVVDNMQWVDVGSLEIMKYLLRSLRDNPITFIFIYRQEERTKVLAEFISSISRESVVKELGLSSFRHNEIIELVGSMLGEKSGNELVSYIEQESGGNPFYIEELIKNLNETDYLKVVGNKWEFNKPEVEIIPKSIEDITDKKYQGLSKEAKEIIEIASVIGWFDIAIIKNITGYNEGHIVGLLEDIKRLGLISERGDRVEFQEELSRQAIYKRYVAGIKAQLLHSKMAVMIEQQYQGKEEAVIDELAFHYYHAGDKEKGVQYCIKAGDKAKEKYANSSAIKYYSWTLARLKAATETERIKQRIDCLIKRADVLSLIGDNEGAIRDLDHGLKDVRETKDNKREAEVRKKRAIVYLSISQYKKSIEAANGCIEINKKLGDKTGIAQSLMIIGSIQRCVGNHEKALIYYRNALNTFRAVGDSDNEANTLVNLGLIYNFWGRYSRALKYYKDALKISKGLGNKDKEATALCSIGIIYKYWGEYNRALKYYQDALKISITIGDRSGEANTHGNSGVVYDYQGKYNESLKHHLKALKIFRDIGDRDNEAATLSNIGNNYRGLGDYYKALEYYRGSLKINRAIGDSHGEAVTFVNIGNNYRSWAKYKKALEYYENALKTFTNMGSRYGATIVLNNIGETYMAMGKLNRALKYFKDSLKIAREIKIRITEFDSLKSFADLYLFAGEIKKANKFINKAYTIARDLNSREIMADVLLVKCNLYLKEKNLVECKKTLATLKVLHKAINLKSFDGSYHLLLGHYYTEIKKFKKADMYLNKSLKIFSELEEQLNIGKVYYYLGQLGLAMLKKEISQKHLGKSLEIFKFLGAKAWEAKAQKILGEQ